MSQKAHLLLLNVQGVARKFDIDRNVDPQEVDTKEASAYQRQNSNLSQAQIIYERERNERLFNCSLDIPEHIECIEIDF